MLEKLFGFDPKRHNVRTEIIAGITTFLTMAYILAVNPNILAETGMDKGALFTTTVIMAAASTMLMGLYAKLSLALAPGMGLNAFFAYTVCMVMGYSWQFALTAVFLEGLLFLLLTVTNLREKIVDVIPATLKNAISVGIGLYIAFIGLKTSGVIVDNPATLVSLGNLGEGQTLLSIIGIGHYRRAFGPQCQGRFAYWHIGHYTYRHTYGADQDGQCVQHTAIRGTHFHEVRMGACLHTRYACCCLHLPLRRPL